MSGGSALRLLVAALVNRAFGWMFERWAARDVREFAERFPGRCLICSLHAYGWQYGHEDSPSPAAHACIEADCALDDLAGDDGSCP